MTKKVILHLENRKRKQIEKHIGNNHTNNEETMSYFTKSSTWVYINQPDRILISDMNIANWDLKVSNNCSN